MWTREITFFVFLSSLCTVTILSGCSGVSRTLLVETKPSGALINVDGKREGQTPLRKKLTWKKEDVHTIVVDANEYERESRNLGYEQAHISGDPWNITFDMKPLVIKADVDVTSNVDRANVIIDGVLAGTTPLRHTFIFNRPNSKSPWSSHLVEVSKEGYRFHPSDSNLPAGENPPFSLQIGFDSEFVTKKLINVNFEPIRFVRTKVRRIVYSGEGVQIEEAVLLSQVGEIEREPKVQSVTKITDFKPSDLFIDSRISVMPNGETILYSLPFVKPGSKDNFSNIWTQKGNELTRLTDSEVFDIQPNVTNNGNWIYFSSNRLNNAKWNLWRISTAGRGGLTKITDSPSSRVDTDPVVSPDCSKLAYTSYLLGVQTPHIWVSNIDGTLPTQLRVGKSPSWSPDGLKIAFVTQDTNGKDRIWVMGADGGNPTQLTSGDYNDQYPVWTPDGTRIIYASDQGLNEEGEHNYDIWLMNADGTGKTQLTINGSNDTLPSVSPDGKYIYFISNRGAQTEGQRASQIWRIELSN